MRHFISKPVQTLISETWR